MIDLNHLGPLLERTRQGDGEALDTLLDCLRPYLHQVVLTEGGVHGRGLTNSDIVQLTLLGVYKGFSQFQGATPGELLAWTRRICQNLIVSTLRRRRSLAGASPDLPSSDPSPWEAAEEEERRLLLLAAVDRLPEHRRQVIWLRVFEDLPFAEVGRRMGRSEEACRVLWVRAIAELRGRVEGMT